MRYYVYLKMSSNWDFLHKLRVQDIVNTGKSYSVLGLSQATPACNKITVLHLDLTLFWTTGLGRSPDIRVSPFSSIIWLEYRNYDLLIHFVLGAQKWQGWGVLPQGEWVPQQSSHTRLHSGWSWQWRRRLGWTAVRTGCWTWRLGLWNRLACLDHAVLLNSE